MELAKKIVERYIYIYYSENAHWLQCNKIWNDKWCMCIDEIELNVATLLFKGMVYHSENIRFEFRDYTDCNYYYMKISDRDCDISAFDLCEYCKDIKIIKHDPLKNKKKSINGIEEQDLIIRFDESIVMYCVLCLLSANQSNRSDIIRFYLLKRKNAFTKYLLQLKNFLDGKKGLKNDFLEFHVKLIEFILEKYALGEKTNLLEDVFSVFDNDIFQKNYKIENNANVIKEQLEEDVTKYITDELPELSLKIQPYGTTIISVIANITKNIKTLYDWELYKNHFKNIYNYLIKILKLQRRETEHDMKNAMKDFNKYLQD